MENTFETLRKALENREIVTVKAATDSTQRSREEIVRFVKSDPHLRIFDEEKGQWINENVDGHC